MSEEDSYCSSLLKNIETLKYDPQMFKLLLEEANKRGLCVGKTLGSRLLKPSATTHHYYYNEYIK
jgi:hypothetical protein